MAGRWQSFRRDRDSCKNMKCFNLVHVANEFAARNRTLDCGVPDSRKCNDQAETCRLGTADNQMPSMKGLAGLKIAHWRELVNLGIWSSGTKLVASLKPQAVERPSVSVPAADCGTLIFRKLSFILRIASTTGCRAVWLEEDAVPWIVEIDFDGQLALQPSAPTHSG
jgi:hypothetical protein